MMEFLILNEPISYYLESEEYERFKDELKTVDNPLALSYVTKKIKNYIINKTLINSKAIIEDINNVYIGPKARLAKGCVIKPGTYLYGETSIDEGSIIGPNTYLENVKVGKNNTVLMSHIVDSTIGHDNQVGPFARIRGNALIEGNSRVGNFVELKGAHLHEGVKSAHLTYLGDCEIGERTNIGCGTITANYDGYNKSRTNIGKDVFVGSGSILIAPINVEDEAFLAAGGTFTKDVTKDDLAIARARQENLKGYSHVIKNRAKAKKEASKK